MYHIVDIANILQASLVQNHSNTLIEFLLLDSRKLSFPATSLFFAIKGENHDGHQYLEQLYQNGVRNFVIERNGGNEKLLTHYEDVNVLAVKNTVQALQKLGAYHRKQFSYPLIGITGSNGKTVIKEWLYQLLQEDYHIVRSPKSYNSQVGVPLSVWQMREKHELGIFEAGISEMHEMENLAQIIRPNIGILSNIGTAHSRGFANQTQKAKEKLRLFQDADLLIYCVDYPEIAQALEILQEEEPGYGMATIKWSKQPNTTVDYRIQQIRKTKQHTLIQIQQVVNKVLLPLSIPFTDDASIENVIYCYLLLQYLGYTHEQIQERIVQLSRVAMRLEMKAGRHNCTIINDCYNSDIKSLAIALDFLQTQNQHSQKILVLSDILQSGEDKKQLYREVTRLITQKKVNQLIGIGSQISKHQDLFDLSQKHFFPDTQSFIETLPEYRDAVILLKGARTFEFERIIKLLEKKAHGTILEINLNAMAHNLKVYRKLLSPYTKLMVMVKAFSYGTGSFEVANLLQFSNVDYLAVAYTDEGVALRKAGIRLPIMVMNPEPNAFDDLVKHQLEPEIYSFEHMYKIETYVKQLPKKLENPLLLHLKFDTGMHRLGFEFGEMEALTQYLKDNPFFRIRSVLSHLAASDEPQHDAFSQQQIARFQKVAQQIEKAVAYPILKHLLNTSGIIRFRQEAQMDMVRLGIGLYGIDPTNTIQHKLANVSTLKTYIAQIKEVAAGETVGYGRYGNLQQPTRIATVNIGYGDGYNRRLSNGVGKMMINGKLASVIGKVCMDMCMLDITHIPEAQAGDEVIVFGGELTVQQIAEAIGTIPYEVFTAIGSRVKRVYFQE